jgi:hypothetical protein
VLSCIKVNIFQLAHSFVLIVAIQFILSITVFTRG